MTEVTNDVAPPSYGVNVLPDIRPRRQVPRRLTVLATVVALTLGATAFLVLRGGSPGGSSVANAATVLHEASARAVDVGSSQMSMTMTMSVMGQQVTATGNGVFDLRRRVGEFTMQMDQLGSMTEVITRHAIYMRMPDGMPGGPATGGRPWVRIRFAALRSTGVDLGKLMNANPTGDPSSAVRALATATDVRAVGSDDIRGVLTTHYTATGTLADILRAQSVGSGIDLSTLPAAMAQSQIHFDVWVDHSQLPRQLRMDMTMPDLGNMTMTMNFFGYGDPVDIVVPPASIVADISDFMSSVS